VEFRVSRQTTILDQIDLAIEPGEQVALVGASGSGKSTLALLLAQLYEPSRGRILVDGSDLADWSKMEVARNITMISQHPFIFTGTIRDNILYARRAAAKEAAVDRKELLRLVDQVGLSEDLLRFGFNMVPPRSRILEIKDKILQMRAIVHSELADQFSQLVEFYDPARFLFYSSLRDNLVYGESLDHSYDPEVLAGDPRFRQFLQHEGLEEDLLQLGMGIAIMTVRLLGDLGVSEDDEFFFQGTPMQPDELGLYRELLDRPLSSREERLLLTLALRFIPGRHRIVRLPDDLPERILTARRRFLRDFVEIDISGCDSQARLLQDPRTIGQKLGHAPDHPTFVPFCPTAYLYRHSIRANILFGAERGGGAEVEGIYQAAIEAFRRADLLDDILDIGLDFHVGSQGDRLSGGQQQKVAIARALLKKTPILIMDEATASLDNTSQAKIQQLLAEEYRGKVTVVAVIHRLDLAPSFDRIVVLDRGRIVEQGSYHQLCAKKGMFYGLLQGSHHP